MRLSSAVAAESMTPPCPPSAVGGWPAGATCAAAPRLQHPAATRLAATILFTPVRTDLMTSPGPPPGRAPPRPKDPPATRRGDSRIRLLLFAAFLLCARDCLVAQS